MKTIKKQFKKALLLIALLITVISYAQSEIENKPIFVRIYNLEGKKINKGKVISVNDSILRLKRQKEFVSIDVRDIGVIKTKRSGGHNVAIGALVGATVGAISGATLFEPDPPDSWFGYSRGDNAAIGGLVGAFSGLAVGGVTAAIKKTETYIINGDIQKWKNFMEHFKK